MPVNDPFVELTPLSSPKANNMMIIGLTGTQIDNLNPTYPGQIVFCNATSGSKTVNHWYGRSADNQSWIDQTSIILYDLYKTNALSQFVDRRYATKEMWMNSFTGTAAAINNNYTDGTTARIDLITGTQSTGVAEIAVGGPIADFTKKMFIKIKIRTPASLTGEIVKIGCNVDKAGTGPSGRVQYGFEYCDGSTNWQIHTCDGAGHESNFDTLKAVVANTVYGFTVEYNPGVNTILYFDDATIKTKTTDPASTGSSTEADVLKVSICNNAGNTTSKTLQVIGACMGYTTNDTKWLQQP